MGEGATLVCHGKVLNSATFVSDKSVSHWNLRSLHVLERLCMNVTRVPASARCYGISVPCDLVKRLKSKSHKVSSKSKLIFSGDNLNKFKTKSFEANSLQATDIKFREQFCSPEIPNNAEFHNALAYGQVFVNL